MKKPLLLFPIVSFFLLVVVYFGFSMPAKKKLNDVHAKNGFAVVELFTSEGCSSCPPADEALAALAKDYPSNVYVLGFHVDYWNNLGWKDEFSDADFTKRQQDYATAFNLDGIYTPQAIVNGKTQFTGSEKATLYSSVEKELNTGIVPVIDLSAKAGNSKGVTVTYKTNAASTEVVCIALVQLNASSEVKRGENKGKLLHHVDVVRGFKTLSNNTGSATINYPAGLSAKDCKIVAFVQHKTDMHIVAAAECEIK